jgi:hypothetical protein
MLKLYKKAIPVIGIIQLVLFLIILVLGLFAKNYYTTVDGYSRELEFFEDPLNLITIGYQLVFYVSILNPILLLYKKSLKRVRMFAIFSWIFYFILTSLYLFGPFGGYYGYDIPNSFANILDAFWIGSYIIFFILFLSSLVVSFIAPRNKSEAQLRLQKSKTSKDAAEKIRDLKKLLDEGIISKEVFDEKSKKYIEEL